MKLFGLFFAAFLIGLLITTGARYGYLLYQVSENHHRAVISPAILPTSAFSLEHAPRQSLKADITSMSGGITWQSRTGADFSPLISIRQIQQGENIKTAANGKLTLNYPDLAMLLVLPKTKLEVIQTLPSAMVFKQDSGVVSYTATRGSKLSVRSLHLLTEVDGGKTEITTDDTNNKVRVTVISGTAKVSYNDSNNTTSVTTLNPAQTLNYDDGTRTVNVR